MSSQLGLSISQLFDLSRRSAAQERLMLQLQEQQAIQNMRIEEEARQRVLSKMRQQTQMSTLRAVGEFPGPQSQTVLDRAGISSYFPYSRQRY